MEIILPLTCKLNNRYFNSLGECVSIKVNPKKGTIKVSKTLSIEISIKIKDLINFSIETNELLMREYGISISDGYKSNINIGRL